MKMLVRALGTSAPILLVMCLYAGSLSASPQLISLAFNGTMQPQQVGADGFRQKLIELAPGDFSVDERSGNTLGSEAAMVTATQSGALDLIVVSGAVLSSVVPEFGVFEIPFLFRNAAHAEAVARGPVAATIAAKFADKGLVLLALGKQGFANMTNSKRPIHTPADLAGIKMRVIPNELRKLTFTTLGADAIPMAFPLVYSALKDGRIEGQDNSIGTIEVNHLYEVQKYLSLTNHFFAILAFIANRDSFERLNAADQAAVIAAAQAGADATWHTGADADAKSLEHLRSAGMDIVETIDRQPFVDAVKPMEPEFEKRFGKDLISAIRSTP